MRNTIYTFCAIAFLLFGTSPAHGLPQELQPIAKLLQDKDTIKKLPIGSFSNIRRLLFALQSTRKKQTIRLLQTKPTLIKMSYGTYFLAMRYLQEKNVPVGMKLLYISANQYLNPFSQIKLAQFYYHGKNLAKLFPQSNYKWEKDLKKSYHYLLQAFAVTNITHKQTKNNLLLNYVVRNALGLHDAFRKLSVNQKFDIRKVRKEYKPTLEKKLARYKRMYHPEATTTQAATTRSTTKPATTTTTRTTTKPTTTTRPTQ